MLNVYDFMKELPANKRLIVNDLVFADYKCPLSHSRFDMWTHHNYFVYVMRGKKKWFAQDKEVMAGAGDCIFVKKGAHSIYQYFDDEFCSLFMFLPDDFIKSTVINNQLEISSADDDPDPAPILRIQINEILQSYFLSFLSYISNSGKTGKKLAELKFRELIMIVAAMPENGAIAGYFHEICNSSRPSLQAVMESNFTYPMKLEEFARLCGRSLSLFKRDFKNIYETTPGRWLTQKRLEYGKYLLEKTDKTVTEIVFDCGLKNHSHFTHAFKKQYGVTPAEAKKTS
ncbi:MAG: AraC family transcriptional regulator [Balneolaceae bacterium]|nr:MAG: AraC family transcriptional regulator [Balneolaceae bacterium]